MRDLWTSFLSISSFQYFFFFSFVFSTVSLFWDGSGNTMNMKMVGVVGILMVDVYSEMDLYTSIFLGEATKHDFSNE
jgi:hypothetical protein